MQSQDRITSYTLFKITLQDYKTVDPSFRGHIAWTYLCYEHQFTFKEDDWYDPSMNCIT